MRRREPAWTGGMSHVATGLMMALVAMAGAGCTGLAQSATECAIEKWSDEPWRDRAALKDAGPYATGLQHPTDLP